MEYLGFLGNENHVETIWKHRNHSRGEVREALARLANRSTPRFQTIEGLRSWFAEHRPGGRDSWANAGFREIGVELPQPGDPTRLPALLDLLEHRDAWIRCNAVRLLRLETEQNLPWKPIANDHSWHGAKAERKAAVGLWRAWARSTRTSEESTPRKGRPSPGG